MRPSRMKISAKLKKNTAVKNGCISRRPIVNLPHFSCGIGVTGASASFNHGSPPMESLPPRHAYLFLLQLEPRLAFMGCTPEKLFKIHGDQLTTEAIAGTRPRGENVAADQELASQVFYL